MTYLKAPMKQSNQCSPQRANMRMRSSKRGYTNNHPNLSVNVLEKENEYLIELAIPGYKKDEIELQILNNTLLISANIEEKEDAKYIRQEFRKASFERSFKLGESVDQEQISAHYNAGILLIKLNKKEDQKPRTIKLKD